MAFVSGAGQTYFVGVFGPEIQAEFGLDRSTWGQIYMAGTLLSALAINWTGALIDRVSLRRFTLGSLLGLGSACLAMSIAPGPVGLIFTVFMVRQFGQGLTSHTSSTSMARYFDDDRGKALALAAIGYALGESLLPASAQLAISFWGWRATYAGTAVLVFLSIFIALRLLQTVQLRHQMPQTPTAESTFSGEPKDSFSRRQMLSEPRFYLILPAVILPSLIITALFFFPAQIALAKGWTPLWVTGNYWVYSLVAVTTTLSAGGLIDRYSARRIMPIFLIPMILSLLVLSIFDTAPAVWLYLALLGISGGLYYTGISALWAELYGAENLGAIKSTTHAVNVFASALGPALVGGLLDRHVSFEMVCFYLAVASAVASMLLFIALRRTA